MTFWESVGLAYSALLVAGIALGRYLATRFPRGGRGRGVPTQPADPTGPTHGMEGLPDGAAAAGWLPLGTEFDRALLPAAFPVSPVGERV